MRISQIETTDRKAAFRIVDLGEVARDVTELFDAARGGVGYATSGDFVKDITSKLEDYKTQIISGKIVPPTKSPV